VVSLDNASLFIRNSGMPKKVHIQIRPTANLEGQIDQLAFFISDAVKANTSSEPHKNLETAYLKQEATLAELKNKLSEQGLIDEKVRTELIEKAEKDLFNAIEIVDHSIINNPTMMDLASLVKSRTAAENDFANSLKVQIGSDLPEHFKKD